MYVYVQILKSMRWLQFGKKYVKIFSYTEKYADYTNEANKNMLKNFFPVVTL